MGIVDEDVARVRETVDFVAVVSEHVALRKQGARWVGLCPFHAEKTPSFSVNAEDKLWYCFGCSRGGDVIGFLREVENLDFVEAVERLATKAGIQLRYDNERAGRDRQRRTRLVEAMGAAVAWYHERLLSSAQAGKAREYLRSRGYDGELVRRYQIGWAPDDWDALARGLQVPHDVLREAGLAFVNRRDRLQDSFRARVMFPIYDVRGDPVAFGGRVLPGAEGPKYKNSAETPIYSKSRVLYGLHWSKGPIVEAGEAVVCEGYTDVIAFAQAGLPRAVATCGTALADEHFRMLKNFARRVVLAYDADAAGQAAAERFYDWERRYEVDIAVAALPAGADPADVARRDPTALRAAVAEARPFLAFRVERVLAGADLRSPEGRARAAETALAVVGEHPNDLVRDQYLVQVAERCRIDADRLRSGRYRKDPDRSRRTVDPRATRVVLPQGAEEEALLMAVHRPEAVASRLHEALFAEDVNVAAFRALASAETLTEAIDGADPEAAALLRRLAVEEADTEPDDALARLVHEAASRAVGELDAQGRQGGDLTHGALDVGWVKLRIEDLWEPARRGDAIERLVRWLTDRRKVEC